MKYAANALVALMLLISMAVANACGSSLGQKSIFASFPVADRLVRISNSSEPNVHRFRKVRMRTALYGREALAAVVLQDDRLIDLSSLFLSRFIECDENYIPIPVSKLFNDTYTAALNAPEPEIVAIHEAVVWAAEAFVLLPGHNMDNMLNLLWTYSSTSQTAAWLVPNLDDLYYRRALAFLHLYGNVTFRFFELDITYLLTDVIFVDQIHWLRDEAYHFVQETIVSEIMHHGRGKPFHKKLALLKLSDVDDTRKTPQAAMHASHGFHELLKDCGWFLLDIRNVSEAEKIFYVNSAEELLISWGAMLFINLFSFRGFLNIPRVIVLAHPIYSEQTDKFGYVRNQSYQYNIHGHLINVTTWLNVSDADALRHEEICP